MKLILGVMVGFYILTFWVFPILNQFIYPWGGVAETHLHPIYTGMILLAGLIVICMKVVLEEIQELKDRIEKTNSNE